MKRRALLLLLVGASCAVHPPEPRRQLEILFLGSGGHHEPSRRASELVPALTSRGFNFCYTESLDDLNPANLARFDAVLLYGNIDVLPAAAERALLEYVAAGHGFAPLHCASGCFANSPKAIELIGAQFKSHGTGVFRTKIVAPDHPVMKGFAAFESWDETYVHQRHNPDRVVLEMRDTEPWTWVRTHGQGRVFYTAWGHDSRTWRNPGFQDLVERGLRWACGDWAADVRPDLKPVPRIPATSPVYEPGLDKPATDLPAPLTPAESMTHLRVPPGFEVTLFAAEPDIVRPIAMAWDERGRLWVAESLDYPNRRGRGSDRIKICEDTDGDGRADKFTIFADRLSIPTSIVFARGGVVVFQAPETLFLQDTDGDGRADRRETLFTGWGTFDTHAGPSNFRWGHDNWLWGTVGYSGFDGIVGGRPHRFGSGIVRVRPDGRDLEFVAPTTNNTWGLGLTEDFEVVSSTANDEHSDALGVPNRAYESVRGWNGRGLRSIADHKQLHPIVPRIQQVDWQGGYTAAAGSAVYTARAFPRDYWNRAVFVAEPTGHLVHQCFLEPSGSGFVSRDGWNLLASDDEWCAPIAAEVGPDGAVWVIDWYNYVVQHNVYAKGQKGGPGNAYETPNRDDRHGRIYRVAPKGMKPGPAPRLDSTLDCVAALRHSNMFWRLTAQRLLVERGSREAVPALRALLSDDVAAIHAIWTLHAMGESFELPASAKAAARKTAAKLTPTRAMLRDPDPQVRREAFLAIPAGDGVAEAAWETLSTSTDPWLTDAAIVAASKSDVAFLNLAASRTKGADAEPPNLMKNPSFEEAENGQPLPWTPRTYSGTAQHRRVEGGHSGKYSIEISSRAGSDTSWFQVVAAKPNTLYRLSAWVKTENLKNKGDAFGALLNLHTLGQTVTPALTGTNDWTRVEVVFNSADRSQLDVNCLLGGWGQSTGTAWWDDVCLQELGPANGVDGAVRVVARHFAMGAPTSVAAVIRAFADREILEEFAAHWPEGRTPDDLNLFKNFRFPAGFQELLLELERRWGRHVFNVDVEALRAGAQATLDDASKSVDLRLKAARSLLKLDDDAGALLKRVTAQAPPDFVAGLFAVLAESRRDETGDAVIAAWDRITARAAAVDLLLRRPAWTRRLLAAIEAGKASRGDVALQQWHQLSLHPDPEIVKLAAKVRGAGPASDRKEVIEQLAAAAARKGDVAKGKEVFRVNCMACHAYAGDGGKVGPDLTGVADRAKEALLVDLLDPNRSVEANFRFWSVTTKGGETLSGRLVSETKTTVELMDRLGATHVVQRAEIESMKAAPQSVMAEGFEELGEEKITDLLEFLKSAKK